MDPSTDRPTPGAKEFPSDYYDYHSRSNVARASVAIAVRSRAVSREFSLFGGEIEKWEITDNNGGDSDVIIDTTDRPTDRPTASNSGRQLNQERGAMQYCSLIVRVWEVAAALAVQRHSKVKPSFIPAARQGSHIK